MPFLPMLTMAGFTAAWPGPKSSLNVWLKAQPEGRATRWPGLAGSSRRHPARTLRECAYSHFARLSTTYRPTQIATVAPINT